ncbi:cysteine desulfurase family protein [Thermoflavifilum thermophilum]|uniref:cysteine desulfurase n=1 Tax=Thermoflavifilum thermophilum TaxID=1393122 RepID=A0A1I7NH21_9BACT|nr:cysteine desulfurase family protein [Thermoflavifilum thermophilum]SFV33924.1 cysteine desulfurase [Thermoflavifilum thermophilum]
MNRIYLDNAATTPLDPEVLEAMMPYLKEKFGNPSSIYSYGRETRLAVENARRTVARLIGAHPGEIFFTSGGTESTNTAITAAIRDLGCQHIITSPIEHHATLHTTAFYHEHMGVHLSYVRIQPDGHVDLDSLETLLRNSKERCLVSLMHANNEIGNLLDIEKVGELCKQYDAIFHCDTVQTVGHLPIDVRQLYVHFIQASAHKFHGPKGVGFLYINENIRIHPLLMGGSQERNMRAGTENVYGIVGLAKALEMAVNRMDEDRQYILSLKHELARQLQAQIPDIQFNGDWNGRSLYTVLNVSFPYNEHTELLLFNLDMEGICVSGGSACSSGVEHVSHVIQALRPGAKEVPVRFSFSRYNTREEIDRVVTTVKKLVTAPVGGHSSAVSL